MMPMMHEDARFEILSLFWWKRTYHLLNLELWNWRYELCHNTHFNSDFNLSKILFIQNPKQSSYLESTQVADQFGCKVWQIWNSRSARLNHLKKGRIQFVKKEKEFEFWGDLGGKHVVPSWDVPLWLTSGSHCHVGTPARRAKKGGKPPAPAGDRTRDARMVRRGAVPLGCSTAFVSNQNSDKVNTAPWFNWGWQLDLKKDSCSLL